MTVFRKAWCKECDLELELVEPEGRLTCSGCGYESMSRAEVDTMMEEQGRMVTVEKDFPELKPVMNIHVSIEQHTGHLDYEDGDYYVVHDTTREIVAVGQCESDAWASFSRLVETYEFLHKRDGGIDTLTTEFVQ